MLSKFICSKPDMMPFVETFFNAAVPAKTGILTRTFSLSSIAPTSKGFWQSIKGIDKAPQSASVHVAAYGAWCDNGIGLSTC